MATGVITPVIPPINRTVTTQPDPFSSQCRPYSMSRSKGQGKCATTILADQGDIVTVISDVPYTVRSSRYLSGAPVRKGNRPMHKSTLQIPNEDFTDYTTTSKKYLDGISRPQRVVPYGSQHISQLSFGRDLSDWRSSYKYTFINKDVDSPARLHQPSFDNRMKMNEGSGLKRAITAPGEQNTNYFWTQYNRVHNKLGAALGPGVAHESPIRRQYNPITGDDGGAAWQADNRRVSGNRVLYNSYRKHDASSIIS